MKGFQFQNTKNVQSIVESGQTAGMRRLAWLYTGGWQRHISFGSIKGDTGKIFISSF
jgi:hypothetical protein